MSLRRFPTAPVICFGLVVALSACQAAPPAAEAPPPAEVLRVAVFNIFELSAAKVDQVDAAGIGLDPQLRSAAEILQRVRPDVVLINEIDVAIEPNPGETRVVDRFIAHYLAHPQSGQQPLDYAHRFTAPVNTGVPSGFDLDRDGNRDGPADGWGFGRYPGQYGMAVLSDLPIDRDSVRTFRMLRWAAMPGALIPDGRDGRPDWYPPEVAEHLRLSSKSHWDVSVRLPTDERLHLLASHPTPRGFDGEEDRNGRRNADEIRLWAEYLDGAEWIVDDDGQAGGLAEDASFVLLGDLNADPFAAGPNGGAPAIARLLTHPRIQDPEPRGEGAQDDDRPYAGDPSTRTAAYGRIDYVLPSRDLDVLDSAVFLPAKGDPRRSLVAGETRASDHQLVWVDLRIR